MPGRPRTTLKRLNELLQRVEACGSELYSYMPAKYHEQPDPDDPVCMAWRRAGQAAIENYRALGPLRAQVAAKVARADQLKAGVVSGRG